jgi:mannose-1-phosphate guanylyltransferase
VEKFVEKPNQATAEDYMKEGVYLWNAGMFVVRASVLESAFSKYAPAIAEGMKNLDARLDQKASLTDALAAVYPALTKISVDFAVMEKADKVAVFKAGFDWDDVGEWPALVRHGQPDAAGNITRGDTALQEARGNIVISESGHLVALLGVDDLVVMQTPDATLVCPKSRAQELKKLLQSVAAKPDGARWL